MTVLHWPKRKRSTGELAPVFGIYKVTHVEHRESHEVLAIAGEELPPRRTCKNRVLFELVRPLDYVMHDLDLAAPTSVTDRVA